VALLRGLLYMAIFFPLTFLLAGIAILSTLIDRRTYGWYARFWGRLGITMAGIRMTVSGEEHLPDGPIIVMSNHASNFDILAIQGYFPRPLSWIAKKELFKIPVFGWSMQRGGYIPLDRGDGRKALKSMDEAAQQIRGGTSVIVFPEGTRTRDGHLLPFKRGGFLLAVKAGVPVVPVSIAGSFAINPGGSLGLNLGRPVHLKIHPPITLPTGLKRSEAEDLLIQQVHGSIAGGLV
jgi:1-acyl-sn-glycerol-3-phosphate acyltransferase